MANLMKVCQWCGLRGGSLTEEYRVYFIRCSVCGARGPASNRPEEAVNVWNDGGAAMRQKLMAGESEAPANE